MDDDELLRFLQTVDAQNSFRPAIPKKECNCGEKADEILAYLKGSFLGDIMVSQSYPAWVLAAAGVISFSAGAAVGLAARRRS
jgi:hypothetical protein